MKYLYLIFMVLLVSCMIAETSDPVEPEMTVVELEESVGMDAVHPLDSIRAVAPMDKFVMTSAFGTRVNPLGGNEFNLHRGVDLVGPRNAPVRAVMEGVVVDHYPPPNGFYKGHPVFGGLIMIDHGNGLYTLYGHLSVSYVNMGRVVEKGTVIGRQGNTGKSTGPHLHFEILIDPVQLFDRMEVFSDDT